jgi:hypothetical protein
MYQEAVRDRIIASFKEECAQMKMLELDSNMNYAREWMLLWSSQCSCNSKTSHDLLIVLAKKAWCCLGNW